jgi:17 kDa outer membrane surface antigen
MSPRKLAMMMGIGLASAAAALPAHAFDYSFLQQSPIRYFNDTDMQMMDTALNEVLNNPRDEVRKSWENAATGSGGEVTSLYSYAKDGYECRRVQLTNHARKAREGAAKSLVDMCQVDGAWKLVNAPQPK